jgi:DNA-binding MarR family transcriptional regulator
MSNQQSKHRSEDDSRNFGILLHDVARLMRVAYDRRMKPLGLTRSQWWVLNKLYFHDGISQSELAALLDIKKPTLGRLIDRLEEKGWVRRVTDAADRRTKRVHLTAKVEPMMKVMREQAAETNEEALSGLSGKERDIVIDALRRVRGDLVAAYGPDRCQGRGDDG